MTARGSRVSELDDKRVATVLAGVVLALCSPCLGGLITLCGTLDKIYDSAGQEREGDEANCGDKYRYRLLSTTLPVLHVQIEIEIKLTGHTHTHTEIQTQLQLQLHLQLYLQILSRDVISCGIKKNNLNKFDWQRCAKVSP